MTAQSHEEDRTSTPIRWWMIVLAGVVIVLLSFGGAFLGARLGAPDAEEVPAAEEQPAEEEPAPEEDGQEEAPVALPAGADVRAGSGVPDPAYGKEGDIFIDVVTADVFVRGADSWTRTGNIRTTAQENLMGDPGEQGEQGEAGAQGEQGAPGEPGSDGTQVLLGNTSPTGACSDGDVFIDTVALAFYYCSDGAWSPAGS